MAVLKPLRPERRRRARARALRRLAAPLRAAARAASGCALAPRRGGARDPARRRVPRARAGAAPARAPRGARGGGAATRASRACCCACAARRCRWRRASRCAAPSPALRAAGKPVAVYAERLGSEELFLASAAPRASSCPRRAASRCSACASRRFFLRDLLDRLGVRAEVVRVGEFKSAAEGLVRRGMSESQRAQLEALARRPLRRRSSRASPRGAGSRPARVRAARRRRAATGPRAAREAGLVDACLFPDEVEAALAELAGRRRGRRRSPLADLAAYHRAARARPGSARAPRARCRASPTWWRRGWCGAARGLGGRRERRLPRAAAPARARRRGARGGDPRRQPGRRRARLGPPVALGAPPRRGEARGREPRRRSRRRAATTWPRRRTPIFAESATLTGSIGVVGGKLDLEGLLPRARRRARGRRARRARRAALRLARRSPPTSARRCARDLRAVYELFLERVAEGAAHDPRRPCTASRAGASGAGGARSREGLVDALGGPLEALAEARRRAGARRGRARARRRAAARPRASPALAAWLLRRGTAL